MDKGKDGRLNMCINGQNYEHTDWMINKQTDGEMEKQMDEGTVNIGKGRWRNIWIMGQTYGDTDRMINKQTDGIEERMDEGTEGQMDIHTPLQTSWQACVHSYG